MVSYQDVSLTRCCFAKVCEGIKRQFGCYIGNRTALCSHSKKCDLFPHLFPRFDLFPRFYQLRSPRPAPAAIGVNRSEHHPFLTAWFQSAVSPTVSILRGKPAQCWGVQEVCGFGFKTAYNAQTMPGPYQHTSTSKRGATGPLPPSRQGILPQSCRFLAPPTPTGHPSTAPAPARP
jgi:hypothetical protein